MSTRPLGDSKISAQLLPPPLPLAWSFAKGAGNDVLRLHRVHYRAVWKSRSPLGKIGVLLGLLFWPLLILPHILYSTLRHGGMICRATGKGRLRQAAEQFALAARFGFRAEAYYKLEFYLPERMDRAEFYVNRNPTKDSIYRLLKASDKGWSPLTDKVTFAEYCEHHGIKVAPILASLRKGRIENAKPTFPDRDIFIKRTRGRGGVRAELWRFNAGRYDNGKGQILDRAELLKHFEDLSNDEPYLIQERLVNDARLGDLTLDALATVRLLTAINERGEAEAIRAVFRMPSRRGTIIDNFHAGGIAACVDLATGMLGPASDMGLAPSLGWLDAHPITGAPITGRVLPDWPLMLETVLKAHLAFADRPFIGWDVALTDRGIVIVEGNAAADTDIVQRCCRSPLGDTRFPALALWHLDRLGRLY